MSNVCFGNKVFLTAAALFIFFTAVFLCIQFSGPQLSSHEDPAYHLGHAVSYITGSTWHFPVYSTMSTHYVDHYYFYHRALAFFITIFHFDTTDYISLIHATKIFHSLLSALVFVVFFLVLNSFLAREAPYLSEKSVILFSCIGALLLFIAVPSFTYRLYLYRPHLISIILVLCSLSLCYRRSSIGVAVVSFLTPLFYSLALLVLIPTFFFGLSSMIYYRVRKKWLLDVKLFLVASGSLVLGIMVRPDSYSYVYNAIYIQLFVLYNYFFEGIDRVGELLPSVNDNVQLKIIAVIFTTFCFCFYVRMRSVGIVRTFSFGTFYLFLLSQALFILMIVISRTSEYAVPILFLFLITAFASVVLPFLKNISTGRYDLQARGGKVNVLARSARGLFAFLCTQRRSLAFALAVFLAINTAGVTLFFIGLLNNEVSPDLYKRSSEFLRDNSEPGDIVFIQRADMYPQLALFNQKNRFTVGMADTFTYAYDQRIYWLWKHIIKGDTLCFEKICHRFEIKTFDALRDVFKAKFVFIDARGHIGEHLVDNTPEFIRLLNSDSRYQKVFTDPVYSEIVVFELL